MKSRPRVVAGVRPALDRALATLEAASTFGVPGESFFPDLENDLLQNPNFAANLAQGNTASAIFAGVSPWANVAKLLEAHSTLELRRDPVAPFNLVPTALRSLLAPYAMPSSGSSLAGLPLANSLPNGVAPPGTTLGGEPLTFRPVHSGTNATASIVGVVFRDQNDNGMLDRGELPMTGVKVVLEKQKNQDFQTVANTVTDPNGHYSFPGLSAGTYRVRPEAPADFRKTREARSLNLSPNTQANGQNFGLAPIKERDSKRCTPAPARAVAHEASLLDQVFAAWDSTEPHSVLLDQVFSESTTSSEADLFARQAELAAPAYTFEASSNRLEPEEYVYAEAVMLVGAAAMVREFDEVSDANRFWEEFEPVGAR